MRKLQGVDKAGSRENRPLKRKFRVTMLAIFLFSLFALLIIQFYRIQILEGERWVSVARTQHFLAVTEPFQRGTFFANTEIKRAHLESPQQLAMDIEAFHLHADPDSIPAMLKKDLTDQLMQLLPGLDVEKIKAHLRKKSRNRRLAMWLSREQRDELLAWWNSYRRRHRIPHNALFFVNDYRRSYPFGKLLGQMLHTVQLQKEEKTGQARPTGGLELYFNGLLSGRQGKRILMRSPRHAFETGQVVEAPVNGADVYLTVNHVLQAIMEEELEKGVKRCRSKGGWAVMMEPFTGEILALAQYPFFDPHDYARYFNDPDLIDHTRLRAITDAFEPGSVVKPITLAIALLANEELKKKGEGPIFHPQEKIAVSNGRFPGRRKPIKDTNSHHYLNMYMALQRSSNIYMARLVERVCQRLGSDWYRKVLSDVFGFGSKTDLELLGESRGVLPTPGKLHPNGALEWSVPTPFSMAFGHNLQTTSLQVVRAFAIFANGGYMVKPTLVRKIVKKLPNGRQEVLVDHTDGKRERQFPQVLPKAIVQEIVKALKYATKPGGSTKLADIWGYTEVGKSGTANKIVGGQYSEKHTFASCIGFTPLSKPAFVLLVVMNEPEPYFIPGVGKNHHGGASAAPVFRAIAKRSLVYLGIPPDDEHGYPQSDPRFDPDKADWIKETRLLREIYEKWNN